MTGACQYLDLAPHLRRTSGPVRSRDPIGYETGDASFYGYVTCKPLDYVDPTGLQTSIAPVGPRDIHNFDIRWRSWRYNWILQGTFGIREIGREYAVLTTSVEANHSCYSSKWVTHVFWVGYPRYVLENIEYEDEETGSPDPDPCASSHGVQTYQQVGQFAIVEALG